MSQMYTFEALHPQILNLTEKHPRTYVSLLCRDDDDMVLNFIIHYAIKEFPIRALPTPFPSAPNFQHIFVSIIYPNKL